MELWRNSPGIPNSSSSLPQIAPSLSRVPVVMTCRMICRSVALALLAALLVPVVAQAQGTSASKAAVGVPRPPVQVAPAQATQPAPSQQPGTGQPSTSGTAPAQVPAAFAAFLQELWPDARAKGVTRA